MEQSSLYKCDKCDYTSKFNHNLLRHQRTKHRVVELPSDYEGESESNSPPPHVPDPKEEEEEQDDGLTYDDLEVMIGDKINKVLKNNNLPCVSKRATQSAVKTFMTGNTASILAGVCIGYLLTANAPAIFRMMTGSLNGSFPVATQGQPTQTQLELMKKIIAQQQAQTPPTAVSPKSGLEDASVVVSPPSST